MQKVGPPQSLSDCVAAAFTSFLSLQAQWQSDLQLLNAFADLKEVVQRPLFQVSETRLLCVSVPPPVQTQEFGDGIRTLVLQSTTWPPTPSGQFRLIYAQPTIIFEAGEPLPNWEIPRASLVPMCNRLLQRFFVIGSKLQSMRVDPSGSTEWGADLVVATAVVMIHTRGLADEAIAVQISNQWAQYVLAAEAGHAAVEVLAGFRMLLPKPPIPELYAKLQSHAAPAIESEKKHLISRPVSEKKASAADLQNWTVQVTMACFLGTTPEATAALITKQVGFVLPAALQLAAPLKFTKDEVTRSSSLRVYLLTHVVLAASLWGTEPLLGISAASGLEIARHLTTWFQELQKREKANREMACEVGVCLLILGTGDPQRLRDYQALLQQIEKKHEAEWTSKKPGATPAVFARKVPSTQTALYSDYHCNYLAVLFLLLMHRTYG